MRVILFWENCLSLCPVMVVEELNVWLKVDGPLLWHRDGTLLSKFQFVEVFQKCLQASGLNPKDYFSHSVRIGAATKGSRWGLDAGVIKHIGRWESEL